MKLLHVPSKWYSHLNEIGAGLSVVFICGFLIRILFLDAGTEAHDNSIQFVPTVLSVCTLIYIFALYPIVAKKDTYYASLATMGLILLSISIQTAQTGNMSSVYLTLWVVAILLLGMFGWQILAGVQALSNIYILVFASTTANGFWPLFISFWATQAPFIVSWLLWHGTDTLADDKVLGPTDTSIQTLTTIDINTKSNIIVKSITEGVISINQAQQIELINPAAQAMTEWNENDSLGLHYTSVLRLVDPDTEEDMKDATDPIAKVFTSSMAHHVPSNVQLLSRTEQRMPISINISPIVDESTQEVISVVAVFKDMTKSNMSERQRAEFISTASHEMRTPVAAIEGYLGLALNEKVSNIDEKARTYLTKAHSSTQHLGRLLKDLLTAAKSEDGRLENNPKIIEVSEFVKALALDFVFRAKEKNLLIKTAFDEAEQNPDEPNPVKTNKKISPLYYVNADPERLREILVNLFENALKYTKQGSIIFDIKATKSEVVISVADTGIGISKTEIPHLFQKFYRIDSTDTREIGGTGLGLFLCRQLVEMQGGRIWVESELNLGSTFFVALPRVSSERVQLANDNSKQKIEVLEK